MNGLPWACGAHEALLRSIYITSALIMATPDYGLGPGFEPKHIDRKSLYTSLEERIKYLHYFLDFNAGNYAPPRRKCSICRH